MRIPCTSSARSGLGVAALRDGLPAAPRAFPSRPTAQPAGADRA